MNAKNGIFIGVIFAAFILGFVALKQAMPEAKSDRIYKAIKVYSPYKFEKNMAGLTIIDTRDGRKEKPSNADVLLRMDELDQQWGKKHLKIVGDSVEVFGDNNQSIVKIFIESPQEKEWVKKFYGI